MTSSGVIPTATLTGDGQDPATILFYEAEAPGGFRHRLESNRVFDVAHWQRMWEAVAVLVQESNGLLDTWAQYDLTRVVAAVQEMGLKLVGLSYNQMTDFDRQILAANIFIQEVLGGM